MLTRSLFLGLGIGGLLSANAAFAQVDCPLPVDASGMISIETMADALADCVTADAADVWFEITDRGSYELIYTGPETDADRQVTGIAHTDWAQTVPLTIGTIFGLRAVGFAPEGAGDQTIEIVTYFPDGPDGPRAPDVKRKTLVPGAVEAALFLIGSEDFLIPGEWRIALRHRGRVLAAQRFNLTPLAPQ